MFKVNNKDTSQWRRSGAFIVNFEHISHFVLPVMTFFFIQIENTQKLKSFFTDFGKIQTSIPALI